MTVKDGKQPVPEYTTVAPTSACVMFSLPNSLHEAVTSTEEVSKKFTNYLNKMDGVEDCYVGKFFGPWVWVNTRKVTGLDAWVETIEKSIRVYFTL